MEIKKYVKKIVDDGNVEEMYDLTDLLSEVMEELCIYDKDLYEEYVLELYKMAYGLTLSKEMAEDIVHQMRPYGERWSFQQIRDIQNEYGLNPRIEDLYVVMNSAYNDYKDIFNEDIQAYVKFAMDFINDEDAKKGKVFLYYTEIPERREKNERNGL